MAYTVGKMLDTDVQRIGASRSTVFLAADFEIQQATESQINQLRLENVTSDLANGGLNEIARVLDADTECEETARPIEANGFPSQVAKPSRKAKQRPTRLNSKTNTTEYYAVMNRLNPDVDRTHALTSEPDESKLSISLVYPHGSVRTLRYKEAVDWTRPLTSLNNWRRTTFARHLGPPTIAPRTCKYHPLEKEYLVGVHRDYKKNWEPKDRKIDWSKMDWAKIHKDFNERFEGKLLPGCAYPRPVRSMVALSESYAYHRESADMTGRKFKGALGRPPRSKKPVVKKDVKDQKD